MAASATPPGVVDPTKLGKYPVILSDALRGESPKEILTAIRCELPSPIHPSHPSMPLCLVLTTTPLADNHRPALSSDAAPSSAKLKPSSSSGTSSYDLSFTDDGGKYAYTGSRSTKENQYTLVFDPERKAFILHRLDSTFNMNLTRTPSNTDADALREEHPHLDSGSIRVSVDANNASSNKKGPGAGKGAGAKKGGRNAAKNAGMVESKRSAPSSTAASNKAKAAAASASAAEAAAREEKKSAASKEAEKPKQRAARSPVGSEDSDDDSDDGLLIEYPDPQPQAVSAYARAPAHHQQPSQSSQPPPIRRFSEFMEHAGDDESDEDADAEYDEDDLLHEDEAGDNNTDDGFKLPSPVGRNGQAQAHNGGGGGGDAPGEDELPMEDELMAMLEEEIDEGGGGGMDVDSESSVSEED